LHAGARERLHFRVAQRIDSFEQPLVLFSQIVLALGSGELIRLLSWK
jgi:hypothetical protein